MQPSPMKIMMDQNQPQNVEYFKYLCSMITNDARCTRGIKSRISMARTVFSKKHALLTRKLDLNLRKKLVKCYVCSTALHGAETWTLRTVDLKHRKSFEVWCCRRMEKIICTDCVRNEVLHRVKTEGYPICNTKKEGYLDRSHLA
jgi:hypothetical protein